MKLNRARSFIFGCSVALSLCLAGGGIVLNRYQAMNSCYNDRPPLRSFEITIDTDHSQQLEEQLQTFADKNGFKHETAYYSPDGHNFSVWMTRKDVEVVARSPFNAGEFRIDFYDNDCVNPTVTGDIDGLVLDLMSYLREIPNVEIIEQKSP